MNGSSQPGRVEVGDRRRDLPAGNRGSSLASVSAGNSSGTVGLFIESPKGVK